MTILLKRFTNNNINDNLPNSFTNTQGTPLLRLKRMDLTYSTSTNPGTGDLYQAMKACYQNNPTHFAFNSYGSLGDAFIPNTVFYPSPFDQSFTFSQLTDLIQPISNLGGNVFGQIAKYATKNALGGKGAATYVSPANGKFILNIKPDPAYPSEFVFSIYFNPLQNPNLSSSDISDNLSALCNMISNADPMCFCSGDICTQSALGGLDNANTLNSKSPTDYTNVKNNCTCLSSACQYAAVNEPNNFTNAFKACKNTTACGATFNFVKNQGVYSVDNQSWLPDQCGLNPVSSEFTNAVIPPPPPSIESQQNIPHSSASNKKDKNTAPMSPAMKIMISIIIIVIILTIAYYMM